MKILKTILSILVLVAICAVVFFDSRFARSADPQFGLNFSVDHAKYLGLDWKKLYGEMISDLNVKLVRLTIPWEDVEPSPDKFTFADFDYILDQSRKNDVSVIVDLGLKQPGWPECHQPGWVHVLAPEIKNQKVLNFIGKVVERYKTNPAISAWQVENEPLFVFGDACLAIAKDQLQKEIALVKSLDSRPVILTDSGEKGSWLKTAGFGADIFGSTMYRTVYQHKWRTYITYPLPPLFYRVKAGILRVFTGIDRIIGVELQAEPWFGPSDIFQTPWSEQKNMMNDKIFANNIFYARQAGFAENYLWGVEWWYYGKEMKGDSELWQATKKLLSE